jgi:serine/threonine protein kinase/Tfp pilus assembly protein PilF
MAGDLEMATPDDCPDPDRLDAWLSGTLAHDDRGALVAHLDACASCREELDRRLPAAEVLGGLTPGAGEPGEGRGPAFGAALALLKGKPSGEPQSHDTTEHATAGDETVADSRQSDRRTPSALNDVEVTAHERAEIAKSSRRIGPYEVIERVGRGGMGEVFRAIDPALERVVAVKILAPALAGNPEARRRFLREARAAAAVCHEHVVTIHAVDEAADQPYLVMQFVAGRSLQEKIDHDGPLGLKETLRIGMQIAWGLAAAHAQGLIHRDIKPANILLENGVERVKITDFGLARAASDASLTRSGAIVGTPNYMSPEQAGGEALGPRSDLFSLGGVLYAMATGEPPFAADSAVAVLRRVCDAAPRPIRELNPESPDWLTLTIERLMAKSPDGRYATAEEVAELLRGRLAELQGPTQPTAKPMDRSGTRSRRRGPWILLTLASLFAFAAVIGALAYFRPDRRGRRPESPPVSGLPESAIGRALELAASASRRGDFHAAVDLYTEALRLEPESPAALSGRSRAYSGLGYWPRASADLDAILRVNPRDAGALEDRAHARQSAGDHLGAIADSDSALRLDSGRSTAYAVRGAALVSLGDWGRARADLDEFIRRVPREPWSHYHRAKSRQNLGDLDGAVADFDSAIELTPENSFFYGERGLALALRHDLARALADAERALRSTPGNREFRRLRGWVRAQQGDYDGALADYNLAFEGRPLDAIKLADRASVAALGGLQKAAEADFEAALKLAPSYGWIRARRALYLHAARGDHARAVADCDEGLRFDPDHAETHLTRGLSLLALGEFRRAIADFDRALDPSKRNAITFLGPLSSHYPELYRARGDARAAVGDLSGARADRERADSGRADSGRADSPRKKADPAGDGASRPDGPEARQEESTVVPRIRDASSDDPSSHRRIY